MIKTIKIKEEFNFRELMEYIFKNDIRDRVFRCSIDDHVFRVCEEGIFEFYCENYDMGETYEVEVEEEITEDTVFNVLIELYGHNIGVHHSSSIKEIKDNRSKKFYAFIDGELKLVWERNSNE